MTINSKGEITSYEIIISEHQRKLLTRAMNMLNAYSARDLSNEPGEVEDTNYKESTMLQRMLADLPIEEVKSPGVTHGLCL